MRFFNIHSVAKHEKIEENKNFHFRGKISQCRKKTERGTLWDFPTSILSQNIKKNAGGPFGKKIPKEKSHSAEKIERGDALVSPGMVLRGKTVKTFLVQFARANGAIWCDNIL